MNRYNRRPSFRGRRGSYGKYRRERDYENDRDSENERNSGSDESSDDATTEEDIEPDNEEFEYDFLRTLGSLHCKKKMDKGFFKDEYKPELKVREEAPMKLKDFERHVMLKKGGIYDDINDHDGPTDFEGGKQKLDDALSEPEDDNDADDLLSSGLFKKKEVKTYAQVIQEKEEKQKKSSEALEYLKGNKDALSNKEDEKIMEPLKNAWNDPNMKSSDKWLVDYFLNRRFMEEENKKIDRSLNHAAIDEETISEDEKTFTKMEEFETKYRFRFEEPDKEFIKYHPREPTETVRLKDTRRKKERERKKERVIQKKIDKQREIEEKKEEARKKIMEKLEKIRAVSGNDRIDTDCGGDMDNFDLDDHDKYMAQMFNDDYYAGSQEEFPELTDEERKLMEDCKFDYDLNAPSTSKGRSKDLYGLDFEDMVGDTVFKYKYKSVIPNDYGLTTEQILKANDSDLNSWYGLANIRRYDRTTREEMNIQNEYSKKAQRENIYHKFPSIFYDHVDEDGNEVIDMTDIERKRLKNRNRKMRKREHLQMQEDLKNAANNDEENESILDESTENEETNENDNYDPTLNESQINKQTHTKKKKKDELQNTESNNEEKAKIYTNNEVIDQSEETFSKKKRKKKDLMNELTEGEENNETPKKKKKKKHLINELTEAEENIDTSKKQKKKDLINELTEENTDTSKKQKKKDLINELTEIEENTDTKKKKKRKKDLKNDLTDVEENTGTNLTENSKNDSSETNQSEDTPTKKKNKNKKKKNKDKTLSDEAKTISDEKDVTISQESEKNTSVTNDDNMDSEQYTDDKTENISKSKKNKSKKNKPDSNGDAGSECNETTKDQIENGVEDTNVSKKKKKKKKKRKPKEPKAEEDIPVAKKMKMEKNLKSISQSRLAAYGQDPKRAWGKIKYFDK